MRSQTLPEQAQAILAQFPSDKIQVLYNELVDFIYGWQMYVEAGEDANMRDLMLFRTAIALSRIADLHYRSFDKIQRRYAGFWQRCEQVADEMMTQVNSR